MFISNFTISYIPHPLYQLFPITIFFPYFCRMRIYCVLLVLYISFGIAARAQPAVNADNVWTLQQCVQYAIDHNISIRQDSLTSRLARYTLFQSQMSQLPAISASGNYGRSFGRSVNPTTNQFIDASYNFLSPSLNGNLLLFGWGQVRNTIARNRYSLLASLADLDQLKDDISLNVANGFLTALLAEEQITVSKNQVSLSQAQLDQTRAFAEAGRLPELNVAQLESQLATDSSALINAIVGYNSAILDLKSLLNLDFSVPFSIKIPGIEVSEQLKVSAMQPEEIFIKARAHFGGIKSSELKVQSAEKGLASAKSFLYPQLFLGYQVGTSYASNYQYVARTLDTTVPNGSYVIDANNNKALVYQPYQIPVLGNTPFGTQMSDNFRQTVALTLNIPILNGWQSQYSIKQAKINLQQQELLQYNAELTLKQNVYKAHNNAMGSIQKYYAAKRALDFATKRYELGLTSTVDLLVTQNQAYAAEASLISAKYDLIFKLKVIDYYLGKELKL
jgi:outer membrane protein